MCIMQLFPKQVSCIFTVIGILAIDGIIHNSLLAQDPANNQKKESSLDINTKSQIKNCMAQKKWSQCDKMITEKLADIYSLRVKSRVIPTDLIQTAIRKAEEKERKRLVRKAPRIKSDIQLIEENSDIFFLHLNLAFCKLNRKKFLEAIGNFREAKRFIVVKESQKKEYAFIDYQVAISYKALEKEEGYLESMERALKADPENPLYLRGIGYSYRFRDTDKSIYYLEKYLKIQEANGAVVKGNKKKNQNIYLILSSLYEEKNRFLDTLKYYKKYLKDNPRDGDIHFATGFIAHKKSGNSQLALEHYQQAIQYLGPEEYKKRFQVYNLAGEIFFKEREYQKALQNFQNAKPYYAKIENEITDIYAKINSIKENMNRVKLEILRKHTRRAQDTLEKFNFTLASERKKGQRAEILKRQYDFGKIEWQIARSFENMGNLEESIRYYQLAIKKGFRKTELLQRIKKIEQNLNRFK